MASFDIQGARKAGYSDADIVQHVAGPAGFDVEGARKAGYGDHEIISHLMGGVPNPVQAKPEQYTPPAMRQNAFSPLQKAASEHPYATAAATTLIPPLGPVLDPNAEVPRGMLKRAGRDAYALATSPLAGPIGSGLSYAGNKLGVTPKVEAATEPSNELQRGGGAAMLAGEMALPLPKGINMLPNAKRAGAGIEAVKQAVGHVPVSVAETGPAAMRASEFAGSGGHLPKPISDFIAKTGVDVAPSQGISPLPLRTAHDFYTNAGAKARTLLDQPVQGPMSHYLTQFNVPLRKSLIDAAEQGAPGQGKALDSSMREYRNAKRLETGLDYGKKAAIGAATGYGLYHEGKKLAGKLLGQ